MKILEEKKLKIKSASDHHTDDSLKCKLKKII